MVNIREIVLNILMEYDKSGTFKPYLLKDSLEKYDYLDTRDKAFIKRVVEGSMERRIQIDYILDQFSKTPVSKMQAFIRSLLRMGVYQIMFMDLVPDSAACNEAVKLAQKHKFQNLKGFVNGVLRNISRNKENISYPDKESDNGSEFLSVCYSMPKWICKMWIESFGADKTQEMLSFFLDARPTTIRVKTSLGNASSVKEKLEKVGVQVKPSTLLPYALDLEKTDNIRFLPGFEEGLFAVQDVSSMLVTEIADPKPGQTVVDICSAPGGKTTHAAERVMMKGIDKASSIKSDDRGENKAAGEVIARDISERKCELIRENAYRLGLENINVQVHDARIHDEALEEKADILYMDLPCSGLGIIGRKPDIKYNASVKSLEEVAKLQWEIIKSSWDYVKKGGTLIYSTCTVNPAENQEMVKRIVSEFPFETVDITERLPKPLTDETFGKESAERILKDARQGYIQLLPGECGTDGFFIARLKRK